jgi:pimeloyl-ACP methyl ester carboxylesterase
MRCSSLVSMRIIRSLCTSTLVLGVASGCMFRGVHEQQARMREAVISGELDPRSDATMGLLTAVGDVVTLSDPRFKEKNAEVGLWHPYDFIIGSHPGIYFLQPFEPNKTPVLFVHGINGTPANFSFLIDRLDRSQFQPWVYSYPSGMSLSLLTDHLSQTMAKVESRYGVRRFVVVAHSMGGLVARGFLVKTANSHTDVPLFVTISTPWDGHAGAQIGVRYAPIVVDAWRDLVPGCDYLRNLFSAPLPSDTEHDLIFTFARSKRSFGPSDDRVVTVASQLAVPAQREASHLYGIDDSHDRVLQNEDVSALLNELLESKEPTLRQARATIP